MLAKLRIFLSKTKMDAIRVQWGSTGEDFTL